MWRRHCRTSNWSQKKKYIYRVRPPGLLSTAQGDTTLTEERMQKVIRHSRGISVLQSCPIPHGQLTTNVEFYIQVYLRVIIGGDQKLDCSGPRTLWAYISPRSSRLRPTMGLEANISNLEITDTILADMATRMRLMSIKQRYLFL